MKKTILLIEDEKDIRQLLKEKLTEEGFQVEEATDGKEGLKKSINLMPDLVLLDVVMPKMDGFTMLKKLRKHKQAKDLKVIVLTNLSQDSEKVHQIDQGQTGYIIKSEVDISDIVSRVRQALGE